MKMKKMKLGGTLLKAGAGLVGGVASNLLDGKVLDSQSGEVQAAVKAVAGALVPAILPGTFTEGLGSAMVGVAGYQLAGSLGIGDEVSLSGEKAPAASGIGNSASFRATSVGAANWMQKRTAIPSADNKQNKVALPASVKATGLD